VSDRARRRRLAQLLSAAVFLAVVAIAVAIVLGATSTEGGNTDLEGVREVERDLAGIPQHGLVLGDRGAPVAVVEFGDLQCPACKAVSEDVLPQAIAGAVRDGRARIEFRNLTIIGSESTPAGAAAVAAGRQGRGWTYVELFYRNQGFERSGYVTDEFLRALARGADVPDIGRWNRERRSRRVLAEVAATTEEGERLGFHSTPSFAVDGPRTRGLKPLGVIESTDDLEAAIAAAAGGS
jgi:protein-disulfide isomerase